MARFYGTVQGGRGEVSRLGHASSGIRVSACSWRGRIETYIEAAGDDDIMHIRADSHSSSRNPTGPVFTGTFDELGELIDWWEHRDEIRALRALLNGGNDGAPGTT
jgi:hypothetical protein